LAGDQLRHRQRSVHRGHLEGDRTQRSRLPAKEILFGQSVTAVGRTTAVTGEMALQGSSVTGASFTVDLTMVKSDSGQRDGQFQGRS